MMCVCVNEMVMNRVEPPPLPPPPPYSYMCEYVLIILLEVPLLEVYPYT